MSTFLGRMKEIPYISVDRFEEDNKNSKIFFLSHCHTDHMVGLDDNALRNTLFSNCNVFLYASPISVRILKNMYRDIALQLKELPSESPTLIEVPSRFGDEKTTLTVTTIPAGHCPGSVMFLFETGDKTVLYTGDFRVNPQELHKYKAFHFRSGDLKKLDTMYLDTTFCKSSYENLPSRDESMRAMCKLIDEWIEVSDRHIIDLSLSSYYGSEFLFMEIFKYMKKSIHVLSKSYNLYKFMPDMNNVLAKDFKKAKIHTRLQRMTCCDMSNNANFFVRKIKPSAMVWDHYSPQMGVVRQEGESTYRVCYSCHASCNEIREFVRYLKPLTIEPCVVPEDLEEKEKLLLLLKEMVEKHRIKEKSEEEGRQREFSIPITVRTKEEEEGEVKCERRRTNALLASPPRSFKRKRRISESCNS